MIVLDHIAAHLKRYARKNNGKTRIIDIHHYTGRSYAVIKRQHDDLNVHLNENAEIIVSALPGFDQVAKLELADPTSIDRLELILENYGYLDPSQTEICQITECTPWPPTSPTESSNSSTDATQATASKPDNQPKTKQPSP